MDTFLKVATRMLDNKGIVPKSSIELCDMPRSKMIFIENPGIEMAKAL